MKPDSLLEWAKKRTWFYAFRLPDGSTTKVDIPAEVLKIHATREQHLERVIERYVPRAAELHALDLACHEGFFSMTLARHFQQVIGVEQRAESVESARKLTELLGLRNITYHQSRVEDLPVGEFVADFVLMFGLLYHVHDPVGMLSHVARLSRKQLCIETQILPFDIAGNVEDGCHLWMRPLRGLFGLVEDYPQGREGGTTSFAMIPTRSGLVWLLQRLGFASVEVIEPERNDYEQFLRGQRIIVLASR